MCVWFLIYYHYSLLAGFIPQAVSPQLFFSVASNLLLVYSPGLVLQFVDCCPDHDPCYHLRLQPNPNLVLILTLILNPNPNPNPNRSPNPNPYLTLPYLT